MHGDVDRSLKVTNFARLSVLGSVLLLSLLGQPSAAAQPRLRLLPGVEVPKDIDIRLTDEGSAFVNRRGMTLYSLPIDEPGRSNCTGEKFLMAAQFATEFPYPVPDPETRRTCIDKWPPLLAPTHAKAVGDWAPIERREGTRQWAYKGRPAYTSIRDRLPGEANGIHGGAVINAPISIPAGIAFKKLETGIVFVDSRQWPMYALGKDEASCSGCTWQPAIAPAAAQKLGSWVPVKMLDGTYEWFHEGKALYTRTMEAAASIQSADPGPLHLFRLPPLPVGIAVRRTGALGNIYTNETGMTLYTYSCVEETPDKLSCDQPGDSAVYYMALCGGAASCATTFQLVRAPSRARSPGAPWSLLRLAPENPLRELAANEEGVLVWAYKGKPLFTYSGDKQPGDFKAHGRRGSRAGAWATAQVYGTGYDP